MTSVGFQKKTESSACRCWGCFHALGAEAVKLVSLYKECVLGASRRNWSVSLTKWLVPWYWLIEMPPSISQGEVLDNSAYTHRTGNFAPHSNTPTPKPKQGCVCNRREVGLLGDFKSTQYEIQPLCCACGDFKKPFVQHGFTTQQHVPLRRKRLGLGHGRELVGGPCIIKRPNYSTLQPTEEKTKKSKI